MKKCMSKIEHKVALPDEKVLSLATQIFDFVSAQRERIVKQINSSLVETNWGIGRYIVEFEQGGQVRARYGTSLMQSLSKILIAKMGRGYSRPNLNFMRKFYLTYNEKKCQTLSNKLSWSHICELLTIDDELERSFYENECISARWDVRSLRRQMESGLYLRLALSKDKNGVLALAQKGTEIQTPQDVVRDTYTLEFLGLPEKKRYSERDLERRLVKNLRTFLLELGRGFAFVGEQYPLVINNRHYHVDLVFYHTILKCYVLIDLKKNSVKHQDIGQMNMYLGYFATEHNQDNNPPIGIILSHTKDDLLVEYATYGMDSNLFVSKYELFLPNKEELRKLVNATLSDDFSS